MRYSSISTTVIIGFTLFVTACTPTPPKCSDDATLGLIRKILFDQLNLDIDPTKEEIRDAFKIEYPRATSLDEKVKKYNCQAQLLAGDAYQLPISYVTQLDDKDEHIVGIDHIGRGDTEALAKAVLHNIQAARTPARTATQNTATDANSILGNWEGRLEGDGEMQVTRVPNGFNLAIGVGAEGCGGSLEGSAQLSGNTLTLVKKDDDRQCTLKVVFDNGDAHITEDGCTGYHGMACGFTGKLRKTK